MKNVPSILFALGLYIDVKLNDEAAFKRLEHYEVKYAKQLMTDMRVQLEFHGSECIILPPFALKYKSFVTYFAAFHCLLGQLFVPWATSS